MTDPRSCKALQINEIDEAPTMDESDSQSAEGAENKRLSSSAENDDSPELSEPAPEPEWRIPAHGGGKLLVGGNPGNRGGKGGYRGRGGKMTWEQRCRRLINRKQTLEGIGAILANPNHEAFPVVLKFIGEQAYGKAVARHVVKQETTDPTEIANALQAALQDPGVRDWLRAERPEVLDGLARVAVGDFTALPGYVPASLFSSAKLLQPDDAGYPADDDGPDPTDPDAEEPEDDA